VKRTLVLLAALVVQLGLVGVATAPQLSARLFGVEYLFRVEPLDPLDPFRGAYVELSYPDLAVADGWSGGRDGTVFVPLRQRAEFWGRSGSPLTQRPDAGPYLTCSDQGWQLACGIENWFLPQREARELEGAIRRGDVVAHVKIDDRGNAALVQVEVRG